MKTDSIFYQLFQTSPNIFFELIGRSFTEGDSYEFKSVAVKQTNLTIDGVFLPLGESSSQTVYFVEVQFQKDQELYHRLFSEILLYLRQNQSTFDWQAAIVYPTRGLEPDESRLHRALLNSPQVQQVYLDELGEAADQSMGIGLVKLVVESEENAPERARQLIDRARQEAAGSISTANIVELVETIFIYKFPSLSGQEIEQMLNLSELKQTRVYQEALAEGERRNQLRAVPQLLRFGLSVEQVAQALGLDVEAVRRLAQNQSENGGLPGNP